MHAAVRRALHAVQQDIHASLTLDSVSRRAGVSSFHLQRLFRRELGESLRNHVERVRVERGAFLLGLHRATIAEVAAECGYTNADTFARAFVRVLGVTPSAYRRSHRLFGAPGTRSNLESDDRGAQPSELTFGVGPAAVVTTRACMLATRRHVGPYATISANLWMPLERWWSRLDATLGRTRNERRGARLAGIGYDSPATTAPERLRFDAALIAPELPLSAPHGVHIAHWPIRRWIRVNFVGHFAALESAYDELFARAHELADRAGERLSGLPSMEIYQPRAFADAAGQQSVDVYFAAARPSSASR